MLECLICMIERLIDGSDGGETHVTITKENWSAILSCEKHKEVSDSVVKAGLVKVE